ncbi:MAG: nucleotidyltransferase domain-containing protein [Alphaproteobacteria bacterium]|nr:nucleotidyltransferase domain-containing protein [Alphaproteobacteria bacterium]
MLGRRNTFKYHKTLAPKVWENNLTMNALVVNTLQAIALEFIRYMNDIVGLPITKKDVQDIWVHGSITNYYWDKYSDIDLALIVNPRSPYLANPELNRKLFDRSFVSSWMRTFDVSIFGRKVDISIINLEKECKVGPIYSIFKDKWIVTPQRLSKQELRKIRSIAKQRYKIIMQHCRYMLKHEMPADYIEAYLAAMQSRRTVGMLQQRDQPITSMTMAFKMVRNTGIFRKLRRHIKHDRSKKFQLL